MEYILKTTDEQEAGLSYAANKNGQSNADYIQNIFGTVLDDYVKQSREDEGRIVKENFVKTGVWETDVNVIQASQVDIKPTPAIGEKVIK